jgi:mono/diheme cytochrome c family protein
MISILSRFGRQVPLYRPVLGVAVALFFGSVVSTRPLAPQAPGVTPAVRVPAPAPQEASQVPGPQAYRAVVDRYCVTCHSDRLQTAGLSLEKLDLADLSTRGDVWEKVIRKLRVGMMPPAGLPRPDAGTTTAFIGYLEAGLDKAAADRPVPGAASLHRLNRAEYANAIRDLLDLDIDVGAMLPPDDAVAGFDNNAAALGVTPVLLERYLSAAMKLAPLAAGTYQDGPVESSYQVPADLSQTRHVEGLPFGTRGGVNIQHTFPADGDYVIRPVLWRNNAGRVRGLEALHQLEVLIDNARVHQVTIGTPEQFVASFNDRINSGMQADFDAALVVRVKVKAGPRSVGVTFVEKTQAEDPQKLRPLNSPFDAVDTHGVPRVDLVTITGPFDQTGTGDTPAARRVYVCKPGEGISEAVCARRIATELARRAFRRPVTPAEVSALMAFFDEGQRNGTFQTGIERLIVRILTSTEFLFRIERVPAALSAGSSFRISDLELASRLSFFLWSSLPDAQLVQLGSRTQLRVPATLSAEIRRMLLDPRAQALAANFAGQWLYLRNLKNVAPIAEEFPDFDDDLRQAFKRETELFFTSIVQEDRNVLDLLTADYTFVNERLAEHYGIPRVIGSHFRRVTVPNEARRGLLGHGSVLAVTSNANRTSPVKRGKWILDNILGTPPPPPPPSVPALTENKDRLTPLSMRQAMEQHRANPACASCHRLMDPIGLALENFDAVGGWRVRDADAPIDSVTQLADGSTIDGPVGLRAALLRRPEVFVTTVTEKLMIYALGRSLEPYDMAAVRAIVRQAARNDYRFSSIVAGIVSSRQFQERITPGPVVTVRSN